MGDGLGDGLFTSICGDHRCVFGDARATSTDDGCRCFHEIPSKKRLDIHRRIRALVRRARLRKERDRE